MDLDPRIARPSPILGQLLRLSKRREVAIYLREGSLWIADFIDGHGELVEPKIWFRFNGATAGTGLPRRRMLLEWPALFNGLGESHEHGSHDRSGGGFGLLRPALRSRLLWRSYGGRGRHG
jgi:hypothetical protein